MTPGLLETSRDQALAPGAVLLGAFATPVETALLAALEQVIAAAPFRRMVTPGGHVMLVAMTNCGTVGWVTDRRGYRYDPIDPGSGQRWPAMPEVFTDLAQGAAAAAGFEAFAPDACLINCYEPGARLSLHQDKDQRAYDAPIVSVSLGLSATFLFGGSRRTGEPRRVPLCQWRRGRVGRAGTAGVPRHHATSRRRASPSGTSAP